MFEVVSIEMCNCSEYPNEHSKLEHEFGEEVLTYNKFLGYMKQIKIVQKQYASVGIVRDLLGGS